MINEALAGQLSKLDLNTPVCSRRDFLTRIGGVGLGLTAATLLAARPAQAANLTVHPAPPAPAVTIADVLNFALNLEYLEGEFYSYAITGTTALGKSTPYGPVSFGPDPAPTTGSTLATSAVTFPAGTTSFSVATLAGQIALDELSHIVLLQQVLGSLAISKPAIDLSAMDTAIASLAASQGITSANTLSYNRFLVLSRSFEDTGASAYSGASTFVKSNATVLQTAAQILGVEVYHAQSARVLLAMNDYMTPMLDPIDTPPPPTGSFYFNVGLSGGLDTALTVTRTPSQVLGIVYGASKPTAFAPAGISHGGFFPQGVNGAVTTT